MTDYRTENEADPNTQPQIDRLKALYERLGEDPETYNRTIDEILENGPDAAARLAATANSVAALWGIEE